MLNFLGRDWGKRETQIVRKVWRREVGGGKEDHLLRIINPAKSVIIIIGNTL